MTRSVFLLTFMAGVLLAQMPTSFDASGQSAQAEAGVPQGDGLGGEAPPPQLFGMELPLLDPSNDTVSYAGGKFDVGNNRLVRERFEKFLRQMPDDTEKSRLYRKRMEEILKFTQRYTKGGSMVGSKTLVKIGMGLYEMSDYEGDGGQSGALASAMVSALDVQRANLRRERDNEEIDREIDKLIIKTNSLNNRNTQRRKGDGQVGKIKAPGGSGTPTSNEVLIGANTAEIAEGKAKKGANIAANEASLALAKLNYQSVIVGFLLQRRFDHAVIGARVYRHLFRDGDTRMNLDKESDAYKMFTGISGLPPTITTIDTMASNARREVEQCIEAVYGALAQNRLGEATDRLITATSLGEYMQCVATFPASDRKRIADYWTLRKQAFSALNARNYDEVERIAAEMKKMDVDFDDSLLLSYTSGRKRQSNFALRSARKAFMEGREEEGRRLATEAATIWPRNPALEESEAEIARVDSFAPVMDEFRKMVERKEFRAIYNDRERFRVVCTDRELEKVFMEVIEFVGGTDIILSKLKDGADQDRTIGPCLAYENLHTLLQSDPRYGEDKLFMDAYNHYAAVAHDFVSALRMGDDCEKRREYGSALASYYRAKCYFPKSRLAAEGADRVIGVIVKAKY